MSLRKSMNGFVPARFERSQTGMEELMLLFLLEKLLIEFGLGLGLGLRLRPDSVEPITGALSISIFVFVFISFPLLFNPVNT